MARPLRIEYPGAVYHVTCRGNARKGIFLVDPDRELFLKVFTKVVERFNWRRESGATVRNCPWQVLRMSIAPQNSLNYR